MNTRGIATIIGCNILLIGINAGMFLSKTALRDGAQGAQDRRTTDFISTPMAATSVISNGGQFYVKGVANKTPLTFLVDTGASWMVFDRRNAERVGIDVKALTFDGTSVTGNGPVPWLFEMQSEISAQLPTLGVLGGGRLSSSGICSSTSLREATYADSQNEEIKDGIRDRGNGNDFRPSKYLVILLLCVGLGGFLISCKGVEDGPNAFYIFSGIGISAAAGWIIIYWFLH